MSRGQVDSPPERPGEAPVEERSGGTPTIKRILGTPPPGTDAVWDWLTTPAVRRRDPPRPPESRAGRELAAEDAAPEAPADEAPVQAAPAQETPVAEAPVREAPPDESPSRGAAAPAPVPESPAGVATAPVSEEPAAPREAPRSRRRVLGALAVIAAVVGLAAALALLVSGSSDEGAGTTSVGGLAQVEPPDGWVPGAAALPGFEGRGGRTYAQSGDPGAPSITIGAIAPGAASLLPDALVSRLAAPPSRPSIRARSGDAWIFSYRGLRLRRPPGPLTAHVILTENGAAAVACHGAGATAAARACEEAATSLRAADGVRAHRGLSRDYARELRTTIAGVGDLRAAGNRKLELAGGPGGSRLAARELQRGYARAAASVRSIEALRARPELTAANERIAAALDGTSGAYARMAAAAARGDVAAFDAARTGVLRRERELRRALSGLAGLGYRPTALD